MLVDNGLNVWYDVFKLEIHPHERSNEMARKEFDLNARYDLMEKARTIGATIDGQPATITGARLPFAMVHPRNDKGEGEGVEFAWSTVAYILDNGGQFRS